MTSRRSFSLASITAVAMAMLAVAVAPGRELLAAHKRGEIPDAVFLAIVGGVLETAEEHLKKGKIDETEREWLEGFIAALKKVASEALEGGLPQA